MKVALSLLTLVALMVMACGSDDNTEPPSAATTTSPFAEGQVQVTYYGHSMFTIESPGGVTILTDPNSGIGYAAPTGQVDVITVSHEHFDHNKTDVAPNARVLRGLTDGGDWADVDETVGDVRIRAVPTFHDNVGGAERGKNSMFVFQIGDLRIIHAGDLGHTSLFFNDAADLEAVHGADVMLAPVGGHFTIGEDDVGLLALQLRLNLVIPMHYRTDALKDFPDADKIETIDHFLEGDPDARRPGSSSVTLEAGSVPAGILVLEPQPE